MSENTKEDTRYQELKDANHKMELDIVEMKGDIKTIKESQERLNNNISKVLFIIGGGFIMAMIGFITKGGLTS
jgi:hypothetical protein